jgi:hypothetical protein
MLQITRRAELGIERVIWVRFYRQQFSMAARTITGSYFHSLKTPNSMLRNKKLMEHGFIPITGSVSTFIVGRKPMSRVLWSRTSQDRRNSDTFREHIQKLEESNEAN